jgi:hypothetical protein
VKPGLPSEKENENAKTTYPRGGAGPCCRRHAGDGIGRSGTMAQSTRLLPGFVLFLLRLQHLQHRLPVKSIKLLLYGGHQLLRQWPHDDHDGPAHADSEGGPAGSAEHAQSVAGTAEPAIQPDAAGAERDHDPANLVADDGGPNNRLREDRDACLLADNQRDSE